MPDVVSPETRSRMMAGIRGRNTRPEMILRKGLHGRGFRFRLHRKDLPGKPDLVLPKYHAVIFINGCFWHGHDCHLFRWPSSRVEFWRKKISRSRERDAEVREALSDAGWRILDVWECALKGRERVPLETVLDRASAWLASDSHCATIRGDQGPTSETRA